jgi:hypothetical protein
MLKKKYLQDFLLMTFTVRFYFRIFYFPFFRRFTFLVFFCTFFGKTFCSLRDSHVVLFLGELSPAAPAAWSAASGPAPGRGSQRILDSDVSAAKCFQHKL